jgi:hypothetical protein
MRTFPSVAIFMVTSVVLTACGGADPGGEASPTSDATSSPSPETLLPIISGPCCGGLPLDEGGYETPTWFGAPFTIEVGPKLSGVGSEPEQMVQIGRGRSSSGNLEQYVAFFAVDDADRVLRDFTATPDATVGAPAPFEVGGLSGSQVDASAQPRPKDQGDPEIAEGAIRIGALDKLTPAFFYTESPEASMRLIAIGREEMDVVVYVEAPPRDFDDWATEAEEMLTTMEFLEL